MSLRILFLGASRAVGLLERFTSAAAALGVEVEIWDCESSGPWHPVVVAGLAREVPAPPFAAPEFEGFLLRAVQNDGFDIVVPCVDDAAVALGRAREGVSAAGAMAVCCSAEVCDAMADKRQTELVLRSLGLTTPGSRGFPLLAKPRRGEGARGIIKLDDAEQLGLWRARGRVDDYVLQRLVHGPEYSVDGYVSRRGHLVGMVSRRRLAVLAGEVAVTRTERNPAALEAARALVTWSEWFGPFVVQVIVENDEAHVIDCNPRLGGGVTCSIQAGLAVPEWILRERLGLSLPDRFEWPEGLVMCRSHRDHFHRE